MEDDLTFLHGAAYPRYSYAIDKHFHGYQTLQFMQQGGIRLTYGTDERILEGAWLWPTYPGPRIAYGPLRPGGWWNHRYIAFSGPRVQRWMTEGWWGGTAIQIPQPEAMGQRFDHLLALSQRGDRLGRLRAINILQGIVLEMAEQRQVPERPEAWLQTCIEALAPGPTPAVGTEALALRVGIPASTLRRRFKQAMGVTLNTYAVSQRIRRACDLLGDTGLPVGSIAAQLGYNDVYFFSRQFRQRTGMTPTAYRRGHR